MASLFISENSAKQNSINTKDEHCDITSKTQGVCIPLSKHCKLLGFNRKTIGQYRNKKSSYFYLAVYVGMPDYDKKCMLKLK